MKKIIIILLFVFGINSINALASEDILIDVGIDKARKWFKQIGGKPVDLSFITIVTAIDKKKPARFGYFDFKKTIRIQPIKSYKIFLGEKMSANLYIALIAHEIIHALLYISTNYKDIPGHEYLAYNAFFDIIPSNMRKQILDRYSNVNTFEYETQINLLICTSTPEEFAVMAYNHRLINGDDLIDRILNGTFKSFYFSM